MSSRRTARKNAFFVLYQSDAAGHPTEEIVARWRAYRGELDEYAIRLVSEVERERESLDERLDEVSVGWPVRRMNKVDRAILRLGLYEMLFVENVPAEVAVNEAIELATGFSSEEAPQFVGGVLRGAKSAWLGDGEGAGRRVNHGR